MKKLTTLFLCVSIFCTCLGGICVSAEETYTEGYYTYTVTDGKATITDCDPEISGDITVPTTLGGYEVVAINNHAFESCINLTGITIPDTVTSIGEMAFYQCSNLAEINLHDGINLIAWEAFNSTAYYNDTNNWEDHVLYIGKYLIKAESWVRWANYIVKPGTKLIADNAFNASDIVGITIPESVEAIGKDAFANCRELLNIVLPNGITRINKHTFSHCESLESIVIPDSVNFIDQHTFDYCSSLKNITLPYGITTIHRDSFGCCESLESIVIPSSVKVIELCAFSSCSNMKTVFLSSSITNIGDSAFANCDSIGNVYFCGTKNEWETILFERNNETLTNAEVHFINSGDLNYDGELNSMDLILLRRSLLEANTPFAGDTNNDGRIDAKDVVVLKKLIVNI